MADPRSVPRRDAFAKVTGRAIYSIDSALPYMAHAAVVRAQRAHGDIVDIDHAQPLAAPGVLGVFC